MSIKVVVPWRPDGDHRSTLWAFCSRWWEARGVDPVESPSPDGPFNRGAAINAGLAGEWDVAVVLDADVICNPAQIFAAVELARTEGVLTFAFDRYVGLAPWGTRRLLDTGDPAGCGALRVVHNHESSAFAIARTAWDSVGGFDERFVGWGQDDVAFAQTCRYLLGSEKHVPGDVWHLWHEPSPTKWPGDEYREANQRLGSRYREAQSAEAIKELVWERDRQPSPASTSATSGTA